jgi:hypothetical protein
MDDDRATGRIGCQNWITGIQFNQAFTLQFRLRDFACAAQPAPFPAVSSSESPGFARRSVARRWRISWQVAMLA